MLTDIKNSFTVRLCSKFAAKPLLTQVAAACETIRLLEWETAAFISPDLWSPAVQI